MSKNTRRKISDDTKTKILEAYISGAKSTSELALEHNISVGQIYQWKSDQVVKDRNQRVVDLTDAGATRALAIKLQQKEAEIEAYQKKVAEQAIIIELLRKLQTSGSYQSENELTGLIGTIKKSDRKRKPVKL